jgi:hypothetical protein
MYQMVILSLYTPSWWNESLTGNYIFALSIISDKFMPVFFDNLLTGVCELTALTYC